MEIKNDIIRQKINMREIYRYLGYGANVPDETVKSAVEEIIDSLTYTINPKSLQNVGPFYYIPAKFLNQQFCSEIMLISNSKLLFRAKIFLII